MSLVTAADLTKSGGYDAAAFEQPVACDLSVFPRQAWRQRSVGGRRQQPIGSGLRRPGCAVSGNVTI
jgi:hypothetical protein